MDNNNIQLQWTEEQWSRVHQVVHEEAQRARVAGTFLPLVGPLPGSADYVSADLLTLAKPPSAFPPGEDAGSVQEEILWVDDVTTLPLATLQVRVVMRGAQVADPELTSALQMLRRAANVLARLEDAIIFNGQADAGKGPRSGTPKPAIWNVLGGKESRGLYEKPGKPNVKATPELGPLGNVLVSSISKEIGGLEEKGHLGPFACVLDQCFFNAVQTPSRDSLVLPQDRIMPFLGGGPLLRSSLLPPNSGVVIGLAGAPVDLVVATDVSVNFLQVTLDPRFVFRVYEKLTLRIKEPDAIVSLALG